MEETCDVFILGGGPAGSTAAGLLAERGWKTVVVDKERHPRFHIGESMLPMSTPLFERLGVREQVEKICKDLLANTVIENYAYELVK